MTEVLAQWPGWVVNLVSIIFLALLLFAPGLVAISISESRRAAKWKSRCGDGGYWAGEADRYRRLWHKEVNAHILSRDELRRVQKVLKDMPKIYRSRRVKRALRK